MRVGDPFDKQLTLYQKKDKVSQVKEKKWYQGAKTTLMRTAKTQIYMSVQPDQDILYT